MQLPNKAYKIATLLMLACLANATHAWDGINTGQITQLDSVAASGNQDLRAYMGGKTFCNSNITWGYLNTNDPNFKSVQALLMMAYALNKTVSIYTTQVGGYCQIGYVQVAG